MIILQRQIWFGLFIFLFINTQPCSSQDRFSISIFQDLKLLLLGDAKHQNDVGTIDYIVNFEFEFNKGKIGYVSFSFNYENAQIKEMFERYSLSLSYNLNHFPFFSETLKNIEISTSINYGFIDRFEAINTSKAGLLKLSYNISNKFKIMYLIQLTERSDLYHRYGDKQNRVSTFMGIKYRL